MQDLVDPFAKLRDTCVNAGLVGRGAADSPADNSGKDPSLVSRSLDDHRTAAITLTRVKDDKLEYILYISFHINSNEFLSSCIVQRTSLKTSNLLKIFKNILLIQQLDVVVKITI